MRPTRCDQNTYLFALEPLRSAHDPPIPMNPTTTNYQRSLQESSIEVNRFLSELEEYQQRQRESYPDSQLDFVGLNLTNRLTRDRRPIYPGGWSDIYLGTFIEDPSSQVAVKVLRFIITSLISEGDYESTIKRFIREMTLWHGLKHKNIARFLGFTLSEGEIGLVSRWYSNGNLLQYLKAHPDANKSTLVLDVAEGIEYLHAHVEQLIHADLKGVNIFVSKDGVACIGDFGISRRSSDMKRNTGFTTPSGVVGTSRWMAPELCGEGDPALTPDCDIYSFGWVIVEAYCSGKMPFYYLNDTQVVIAKHDGKLPDSIYYKELSGQEELWSLVMCCLSNSPRKRYCIACLKQKLHEIFGAACGVRCTAPCLSESPRTVHPQPNPSPHSNASDRHERPLYLRCLKQLPRQTPENSVQSSDPIDDPSIQTPLDIKQSFDVDQNDAVPPRPSTRKRLRIWLRRVAALFRGVMRLPAR